MIIRIDFLNINVHISQSKKKYYKKRKELGLEEMTLVTDAVTTVIVLDGTLEFIVGTLKKQKDNIPLVSHEFSHVVTQIFNYFEFTDDELRSYLLQYLLYSYTNKEI